MDYKSPGQNRDNRERRVFDGSRRPHAASLRRQYEDAIAAEQWDDRNSRTITFTTFPGALDILAQLDSRKTRGPHIELLSATATGDKDDAVLTASVYIPESQESWFLRKLDAYVETVENERPRHRKLVESIEQIRKATARLLWTDPPECFPDDELRLVGGLAAERLGYRIEASFAGGEAVGPFLPAGAVSEVRRSNRLPAARHS